ncbi:MAG: glycosyltransferase family 2 protein [Planctomycetota bacterium]|nr:MAG: glycosyltransferase family 2 protein [Planctomycetota bacterium]
MSVTEEEKICIILPAYNEASSIGEVLTKLMPMAAEQGWEVTVVDDGSSDDTGKITGEHGAKLITHSHNRGYGASLTTGARATDANIVVFIDSDGQQDQNDIPRLLEHIGQYDMVVGARTKDSYTDPYRRVGKKLLKWFANYLAKEKIPDINSGFRAFKREVLLRYLHLMPQGFSFSTTSTLAMLKGGHQIKWIPIKTTKRIGTSTVKQLKHGPETMMLMLRLTVLFDPLRVFLPVSGILIFLAVLMTTLNFILYRRAVPASAIFLGISAVIIFMLGLLTDQVSAIRREQHKRL